MRIAQIAPLVERVPPKLYGGTERIASYLTEELVRRGHEATLFASGDSITDAQLVAGCDQALRLDPRRPDPVPYYMMMLAEVRDRASEFDLLHFHIDAFHFPLFRGHGGRTLTTLHGRQDIPDLQRLYQRFREMPLAAISEAQRRFIPHANVAAVIHHGIPSRLYHPVYSPRGGYVAFLGRISPEKRPDLAIRIARAIGVPLKIAAKVDRADEDYYRDAILPLLGGPGVEFVGEIGDREKGRFLGEAHALLFPIDWPEPFGLVTIEAMACGTPVLALGNGSVPEIIDDGVTGRVVYSLDEAIAALPQVIALDRRAVRRRFEERFTVERMADDYLALYHRLLSSDRERRSEARALRLVSDRDRMETGEARLDVV